MAPHLQVHWLMFKCALARGRLSDASGQLARLGLGVIGNTIGILPTGNTGGNNVSMFKRLPIPAELARAMGAAAMTEAAVARHRATA